MAFTCFILFYVLYFFLTSYNHYNNPIEVGTVIIPILQVWKARHREISNLLMVPQQQLPGLGFEPRLPDSRAHDFNHTAILALM